MRGSAGTNGTNGIILLLSTSMSDQANVADLNLLVYFLTGTDSAVAGWKIRTNKPKNIIIGFSRRVRDMVLTLYCLDC